MIRDHPRLCGDHKGIAMQRIEPLGSPPPVRGPRSGVRAIKRSNRITPACAGTTLFSDWFQASTGDHPRLCGDHISRKSSTIRMSGSPPPVRGPQHLFRSVLYQLRITPACAGTTPVPGISPLYSKDHPRLCGDHTPI